MRDLRFDTVHLAAYSVRPGTAAARREDDVPLHLKKERLNHLLAVQREIAAGRNALYVGSKVEILVDGIAEDGRPTGALRENKVAWLPTGTARPGELHNAQVVDASAWQLQASAGRHGGVRTSSNIRAPHLVAAVPEAPHTTLDLADRGDTPSFANIEPSKPSTLTRSCSPVLVISSRCSARTPDRCTDHRRAADR